MMGGRMQVQMGGIQTSEQVKNKGWLSEQTDAERLKVYYIRGVDECVNASREGWMSGRMEMGVMDDWRSVKKKG